MPTVIEMASSRSAKALVGYKRLAAPGRIRLEWDA